MKINININDRYEELEITINSNQVNEQLEKIIASIRALDLKLTGKKGGQTYFLDANKILYVDTVDKKTFLYTKHSIYESSLKLKNLQNSFGKTPAFFIYELEEILNNNDFFRAGKSIIINFNKIKSLKTDIGGRMIVTMENEEKLIVLRQYAIFVKNQLGGVDGE